MATNPIEPSVEQVATATADPRTRLAEAMATMTQLGMAIANSTAAAVSNRSAATARRARSVHRDNVERCRSEVMSSTTI